MFFKFCKNPICIAIIALASVAVNAVDVTPYGFVRFNGVWSDGLEGSSNPNGAFMAELPTSSSSVKYEKASRFDFSVYQSSFGVNMSDSAYEGSLHVTGKLEGDFAYGNGNLKLRQGFANFSFPNIGLNILFGQTWALFVPYDPPTINYQNLVGAGNLAKERPQVRLTQQLNSVELAAAVRKDEDYPAFEGRISTLTPIKIGVSAFYASEKFAGVAYYDDREFPVSWGFSADLHASIKKINISGEFFQGQNLSNYGGISEPYYRGMKYRVKSRGGWGALGFNASDNLNFNAGAGVEHVISLYWGDTFWLNRAIFANINYKPTKTVTLALEYFRHDTEYISDEKDGYNRVETSVTYGF